MKQFLNTENKTYTFSSCDNCPARCCDGKEGTLFSQIITEDFKELYENFPILFIFGELGYLKPILLLTNGKDFCKYLKNYKCTIYEKRPSICKVYPLSAHIDDNTYIDELCPAVNSEEESTLIVKEGKVTKNFNYPTLNNYQKKYIDTYYELEQFNNKDDFDLCLTIKGMNFYKYNKITSNEFMKMHQESLIHLQDNYFTN